MARTPQRSFDRLSVLIGCLTPSTLAAVIADLEDNQSRDEECRKREDEVRDKLVEQLEALAGEEALEQLRPEFRASPAGRMKVQFV